MTNVIDSAIKTSGVNRNPSFRSFYSKATLFIAIFAVFGAVMKFTHLLDGVNSEGIAGIVGFIIVLVAIAYGIRFLLTAKKLTKEEIEAVDPENRWAYTKTGWRAVTWFFVPFLVYAAICGYLIWLGR